MPVGSSVLSWGPPLLRRNHPPENGYYALPTESLAFPEQVILGYLSTGDTEHSRVRNSSVHPEKKEKKQL